MAVLSATPNVFPRIALLFLSVFGGAVTLAQCQGTAADCRVPGHSAFDASVPNSLQKPLGEAGADSHQLCICSPKMKGQGADTPDCQCTDISVLDKLFLSEVLGQAAEESAPKADVRMTQHRDNASSELQNEINAQPVARNFDYKSARAVFYDHNASKEQQSAAAPGYEPVPNERVCARDRSPASGGVAPQSTLFFRRETQDNVRNSYLPQGWRAFLRSLSTTSLDYLKGLPWFVILFSMLATLGITRGVGKLLPNFSKSPSGTCPRCQLRKAEIDEYAQKRLEGKHGVAPRQAWSDRGPRVPLFDSDDEADASYAPTVSQESSSHWESEESSGESCEML